MPEPPATVGNQKSAKPSKTLAKIAGAVKKTDPKELQREREALEVARKRALLSNLAFGVNPMAINLAGTPAGLPSVPQALAMPEEASEEKLQRNRALAEALGVQPATVRQQYSSGWARPTGGQVDLDDFGNELNAAMYPESLILRAALKSGFVQKLEKKWLTFLADDSAASLPLNPMDRPTRTFVHEYSDFWKLKTESFDPEPKRYIHCVKMLDTRAPYPLLSEAARNWRGPQSSQTGMISASDHASQQTAGQNTKSREIPLPPERKPLPLKPRSVTPSNESTPPMSSTGVPAIDNQPNSRFDALFSGRERPKIELAKRTLPLELPPFQPDKINTTAEDLQKLHQQKLEERARKEREAEERKMRVLESVFASDDEEEEDNASSKSSESEWEESEPLYAGSDDE